MLESVEEMEISGFISVKTCRRLIARFWTLCAPYASGADHGVGAMRHDHALPP
jgi:hypothetical protein